MMNLNFSTLKAIDDTFRGMNNLRRWTENFKEDRYNELAKQALNCMVTYLLAKEAEKNNVNIHWERFPKIAIFRGFQKMGLADVTHSTYANIVENKMNAELENFYQVVGCNRIDEMVKNPEDAKALKEFLLEGVNTYEFELYRVASRIATLVEVMESESKFSKDEYGEKYAEINETIAKMQYKIPAVKSFGSKSAVFNMIRKISTLRNQNRWAIRSYSVNCSVLGHLFDTAVYAYLISLNEGMSEQEATKMFFTGIWHDVPECWTKDIPSPTKDSFHGFRDASEEYELECIQKNIYDVLDPYLSDAVKAVMMEEKSLKEFKALMKAADYLSADSECFRQLVAGSRDNYFRDRVLYGDQKNFAKAPKIYVKDGLKELLDYWCKQAGSLVLLG